VWRGAEAPHQGSEAVVSGKEMDKALTLLLAIAEGVQDEFS